MVPCTAMPCNQGNDPLKLQHQTDTVYVVLKGVNSRLSRRNTRTIIKVKDLNVVLVVLVVTGRHWTQ